MKTPEQAEKHRLRMMEWRKNNPEKQKEVAARSWSKNGVKYNKERKERYKTDKEFRQKKIDADKKYCKSGRKLKMARKPENMEQSRKRSKRLYWKNREQNLLDCKQWRKENPEKTLEYSKVRRDTLPDNYIKHQIKRSWNIELNDITPEMIKTKRLITRIRRVIKNNN